MTPVQTQGIKYAGSKLRMLPFVLEIASRISAETVFDGFAGTTRVGQAFARTGKRVISNDLSAWSRVFGMCYLKNSRPAEYFGPLIEHLNSLPPKSGWFSKTYGPDSISKQPWQTENLGKLDAIREEIDRLGLDDSDTAVLITSLILALDAVDSTIGHQAAYLKSWSIRSYRPLRLEVPRLFVSRPDHAVTSSDIFEAIRNCNADLAYLDPPYGSNNEKMPPSRVRYASYYHLWTTVALNDRPSVFGKANRRADSSDRTSASVFEDFRRDSDGEFVAVNAIERMIREVDARFVLLSYSSCGRASAGQLLDILHRNGRLIESVAVDYRRNVMSAMRWTNRWISESSEPNREFLFLIEK